MQKSNLSLICLASLAVVLSLGLNSVNAADPSEILVTPSLVAWISSQCEVIVEEMDAIIKQNIENTKFSLVNYLRFLFLYEDLKLITLKAYDELKWVAKKARAYERVHVTASQIVKDYLDDLDATMRQIELDEPKGKQVSVSQKWMNLYETILYIAVAAPKNSYLSTRAAELLVVSPNDISDKVRSTRYRLKTHAFN